MDIQLEKVYTTNVEIVFNPLTGEKSILSLKAKVMNEEIDILVAGNKIESYGDEVHPEVVNQYTLFMEQIKKVHPTSRVI